MNVMHESNFPAYDPTIRRRRTSLTMEIPDLSNIRNSSDTKLGNFVFEDMFTKKFRNSCKGRESCQFKGQYIGSKLEKVIFKY